MFLDAPPPFALVSGPTQDLVNALQLAAFSGKQEDLAAQAAQAIQALAGGAQMDPPPPVRDSPLVLLAHAWGRGPRYRKALAPLVEPLLAGSSGQVRDRALGVLIHVTGRRSAFMDRLLEMGARAQDWMLQSFAVSLSDMGDSTARNRLRLYAACGWSPCGAPQEDSTLLAIIKAHRPNTLEEWVCQHADVGRMLPANPNGNGADLLSILLAQRARSNQREGEKCNSMITILARSGLLPPTIRTEPLDPWIKEALAAGECDRLERQTLQPSVRQPTRMRL